MPQCQVCNGEVDPDSAFCPLCGARLVPPVAVEGGGVVPPADGGTVGAPEEERPEVSRARVAAAIVIIVLIVTVSIFFVFPSVIPATTTSPPVSCSNASAPPASTSATAPTPNYDVQQVMAFAQSYSQLEFNVTAIAQCDANGYGPAYLVNGLTNTGFWYQVGINWNWPLQSGGYTPGFGFVSEAWAPGGLTRSPAAVAFSGTVNEGDTIELSLTFSGGLVVASAVDLNTGASGSMSYPARGADSFIGSQEQESSERFSFATAGYFTGLMTEWYHVDASPTVDEEAVTYSENTTQIASATLGVGEWDFSTAVPTSVFSNVANNGNPIDLASQPSQLQQFTLNGYTLSADAYTFVTSS